MLRAAQGKHTLCKGAFACEAVGRKAPLGWPGHHAETAARLLSDMQCPAPAPALQLFFPQIFDIKYLMKVGGLPCEKTWHLVPYACMPCGLLPYTRVQHN